jgi:hypothetical protein
MESGNSICIGISNRGRVQLSPAISGYFLVPSKSNKENGIARTILHGAEHRPSQEIVNVSQRKYNRSAEIWQQKAWIRGKMSHEGWKNRKQ